MKKHGLQVSEASTLLFQLYAGPLLRLHVVLGQGQSIATPMDSEWVMSISSAAVP